MRTLTPVVNNRKEGLQKMNTEELREILMRCGYKRTSGHIDTGRVAFAWNAETGGNARADHVSAQLNGRVPISVSMRLFARLEDCRRVLGNTQTALANAMADQEQ